MISAAQSLITRILAEPGSVCITSSFQADCMVLVHLVRQKRPDIPVLFLETGYHFPETVEYRDRLARDWNLNLRNLEATQSVADQEAAFGILNQTAPDRCCKLRKVEPLFAGLADYDTWFTALRREQSPTRAGLREEEPFRLPTGHSLKKVSPLAAWTDKDVWRYMERHNIPALPLYARGYTSIGCAPCTALPVDASDPRSGRWAHAGNGRKLECGIHIQAERHAD